MDNTGWWRDIPGYAGYRASAEGQILDVAKRRLKKQRRAGNGALRVDIGKSTCMVHDLVARAHHGHPTTRGYRVKHLDGDLSNNHKGNLAWSGRPLTKQPPPLPYELERELERVQRERECLIELMQT